MEEVWKGMNLTNTPITPSLPPPHHHYRRRRPNHAAIHSAAFTAVTLQDFLAGAFKDPAAISTETPQTNPNSTLVSAATSVVSNSDTIFSKKRVQEESAGLDRRQIRIMKNRESAARSRARKQAYTEELEQEVAMLTEENAKLKRQHEEMQLEIKAREEAKSTLQRSSTAPF